MADDTTEEDNEWIPRFRVDEELDFFTDLAFHETERWIQAVTKKKLSHPDDLRSSLQNGVLLCELVNGLQTGSVPRINRLNTPIAGLDNLALFLKACQQKFGLRQPQLFDPLDLEDLSQRAAFSDQNPVYLKQETDRRLRNVALTVYWLGQIAREVYSGPQLDQSAFSGLVTQNPGVLSPVQSPHRKGYHSPYSGSPYRVTNSRNNNSDFSSSPRSSSNLSNSQRSNNSVFNSSNYSNNSDLCLSPQSNSSDLVVSNNISPLGLRGGHAASEASYDSNELGSDCGLSIEVELLDPADMSHRGSASNLSRWGHSSPVYSNHDTNSSMYRSSPNLAHGLHAHNLSSSTDSLDGGHGHSRQSSGSMENNSTRRLSSTSRPSATANPLQFIKAQGSNPLAQTAQKQIQIAEESKKIKWDTLMETTEDTDWQSKLGNWKSKRRTKSTAAYDKEEAEAAEKEKEEKALRSTKTFKEMLQEKDRRKSMNSYPIEDENDEYTANNQANDINHNRTESARSMQSSGSLDDSLAFDSSAPWAASSDDDTFKRDNRVGNGLPSESDTESNKETWPEQDECQINNNNEYSTSSISQRLSEQTHNEEKTVSSQKPKSNKLSGLLRAFEEQTENDIEYKPLARRPQKSMPVTDQTLVNEAPKISPRSPRSDKDSVEKSITISQKPNSEKGFGFTFTGGRDLSQPIVIERVSLGGAADVCEVRVKDELLEINRRKVATYSHTQVEDLIKRAVRTGKLELKVKRYIRKGSYLSDEFSEEDSFDRFEEQMEKEQEMKSHSRNEHSGLTPMMDSLLREKHDRSSDNRTTEWDERMQEDEQADRQTGHSYGDMSYSPQPEQEDELHPSDRTQVTNDYSTEIEPDTNESQVEEDSEEDQAPSPVPQREPSPVQQQQSHHIPSTYNHTYTPYSPDSDYTPASVITAESGKPISFDVAMPVSQQSSSDNGPPKALLRWQRRPRSQYEDEQDEQTNLPYSANQTQFSIDTSQSTSNPQTSKIIDEEQEIRPTYVPRGQLDLSREIKRMEDWDRKQEQKRQPDVTISTDQNQEQREFEQNVQAMNSRWQADQQKALHTEQENKQKDEMILSEERQRVADMEQRKAERRASRQAQLAEISAQQQQQQEQSSSQASANQPITRSQVRPHESSELMVQIPSQYGGIQIDPANRPDLTIDTHDQYAEVNFMFNLNKQPIASPKESSKISEVERERERLQQEEAAMRKRLEEEKAAEERKFREREEQIKRQEERLRQEEERLRFEQERLQRERQQHLQAVTLTTQRGESPASLSKLSPSYQSSSPSSLSPPFNSQPEADQQFSSTVVIANSSPNNYYVKSVQHAPYQSPFTSSAPNKREDKPSDRLTREDLMAMSRSARPLEEKPPSLPQEEPPALQTTVTQVKKQISQPIPMVREAPSKQEKHSLNAVPKPRLLDSKGWIGHNQEETQREPPKQAAPRPARRSDIMKKQYTSSQDHWLVQEAERRRLEEQNYNGQRPNNRQYKNGPIKPHESLTTNRWRDSGPQYNPSKNKPNARSSTSFEQMRQKFSEQPNEPQPLRPTNTALQPRAAPRQMSSGSVSSVSSRGESPSWQSQNSANPTYMGRNSPRGGEISRASPKPAPRSRSTPAAPGNSPEPTMAVSGRQRCSHCKEELGYGAAMVIESLNLHYHMQCFRCCVCRTQLGNGAEGADVRVRGWKLHCRNCYSNDEAGLKFSKV